MKNLFCTSECPSLCQSSSKEAFVFKLSDLYPGLNDTERALAAKEPVKMVKAYQLTWKAESICHNLYPSSEKNDESDACRHFVWACLLTKEFGREFSENILNAHEQEPTEPAEEKAMDLANNRRGVSVSETMIKNNNYSEGEIENSFKTELNEGKLVVLKKK